MKPENFHAFSRGYWDGVQFAYIPDYDADEIAAWLAGFQRAKQGLGEPSTEDFEELCNLSPTTP